MAYPRSAFGATDSIFETLRGLAREGALTVRVDGACMAGTLPDGSRVRVSRRRACLPGDVAVYRRGDGRLVSHRFLGYLPTGLGWVALTRADSQAAADPLVARSQLLGQVTHVDERALCIPILARLRALGGCLGVAGARALRRLAGRRAPARAPRPDSHLP